MRLKLNTLSSGTESRINHLIIPKKSIKCNQSGITFKNKTAARSIK